MAITCAKCGHVMKITTAMWYFSDEMIALLQQIYSFYVLTTKGAIHGFWVTQLNKKQIACSKCLKYKGWIDS